MIGSLFDVALATGGEIEVEDAEGQRAPLPVATWTARPSGADAGLLDRCRGATLDIGCGPGRFVAALGERGVPALGIDVTPSAVSRTRSRGGTALQRDVFGPLPGDGRWQTALLADGNLGIGGDPVALLRRVCELLGHRGRIIAEVAAPGVERKSVWAALEVAGTRSRPFRWSVVGVDDIDSVAAHAGLFVTATHRHGARWSVVLQEGS